MNQNLQVHKKKSFVSNSVKYLIAAASIAGTMGLWGLFSKKDVQATTVQVTDAPFPTLVTLVSIKPVAATPVATNDQSISSLPVVTQPAAIPAYTGSSNIQLSQPAPVTSSRSSR